LISSIYFASSDKNSSEVILSVAAHTCHHVTSLEYMTYIADRNV